MALARVAASGPARLQRAQGILRLEAVKSGLATRILRLAHAGCLRACFPRAHGTALDTVAVNTAGGVADGDQIGIGICAGPGAVVSFATQAAERIHGARPGAEAASVNVTLQVEAGARLDWLPQETILFDAAALRRQTMVTLAPDARFLGVEALVFGRAASGETLRSLRLDDHFVIRRGGVTVLHEAIRLHGDAATILRQPAAANGAQAAAVVIYAAPDAGEMLPRLRGALAGARGESGASAWNGLLVARVLAPDAAALKTAIARALHVLRPEPLPRVWNT
jgi:urease accessory protein